MKRIALLLSCFVVASAAFAANPVKPAPGSKPSALLPAREAPESVAHTYIRAMSEQSLHVVADTMHPVALARFKEIIGGVVDAMAAGPANPASEKVVRALFGDVKPEAIKKLEDREVFVTFMTNLSTFLPQIREMLAGTEYQLLGHVDEGGDVAHVVYRAELHRGSAKLSKMEVLSLKRDGKDWKVLLTDDLEALVSGLARQIAAAAAAPAPRVQTQSPPPATPPAK